MVVAMVVASFLLLGGQGRNSTCHVNQPISRLENVRVVFSFDRGLTRERERKRKIDRSTEGYSRHSCDLLDVLSSTKPYLFLLSDKRTKISYFSTFLFLRRISSSLTLPLRSCGTK